MMASNNLFKRILLAALLLALFAPIIQYNFKVLELKPLKGAITYPQDSSFTLNGWWSGHYQEKKENYINEMFGFRNVFVRLNNQLAYSIFSKAKANGVVIGKDNYFFEENYLKAYTGVDFLGEDSIIHILNKLKFVTDTLQKLNKQLLVVFAAGKASYYPEYIPNSWLPFSNKTNYHYLSSGAVNLKLNVIDFNKWFIENKLKTEYPLYPKHGIHWSSYGATLAADSIIKKIEWLRKIDMPNIYFNDVEIKYPNGDDYDIADGMNLLFKLNSFDLAYPKIMYEDASGKTKPNALVIADSYYWGMFNFGISNCFNNSQFWYYNKQVYPESFTKETLPKDLELQQVIEKNDVIVIMATEANLKNIGWGFIERINSHFKGFEKQKVESKSPEYYKKVQEFITYIKAQPSWIIESEKRAKEKNINLDSMIVLDAMWQVDNQK